MLFVVRKIYSVLSATGTELEINRQVIMLVVLVIYYNYDHIYFSVLTTGICGFSTLCLSPLLAQSEKCDVKKEIPKPAVNSACLHLDVFPGLQFTFETELVFL